MAEAPVNANRDDRIESSDAKTRLEGWQADLTNHFAHLTAGRRNSNWPVFGLEHGLTSNEREALVRDVRLCAQAGPSRDIAIPWIVYASEIGYAFSGYEYWQTFESLTPGWQVQWRERIRARFEVFAKTYHGAEPEGSWADHFNIIAWPITHGILPRDLQSQLAELLHDASTSFRADTFSSAESLGQHLQRRCGNYSSRFRQFAENSTLLGQISLALLLQQDVAEVLGGSTVLDAKTLSRIVDDLNRERAARQWLAEARSAARYRVKGLARIPLRNRATDPEGLTARPARAGEEDNIDVPAPRFILRESVADEWQVRLQFPNLAHLLGSLPRARDVLTRVQGRVGGPTGPVLARGRILSDSSPTVALHTWPSPKTPLLSFDGAPPELESLLRERFRIAPADRWLFLIGTDGQARELATRVVRAGESYLVLQQAETRNPVAGVGLRTVRVACAGVYGLRVHVPEHIPEALVAVLGVLGIEVSQTLDVWPVGLPLPDWSGDGSAESVVGQPIILGIRTNSRVSLALTLDGLPATEITAKDETGAQPIFVQLPSLSVGPHRLAITAQTREDHGQVADDSESRTRPSEQLRGELHLIVREPHIAARQRGALSFAVSPQTPSLEDVWEDRIELHLAVPGAATVRCRAVFQDATGRALFDRNFSLPSPCDSEQWRREFASIRKASEECYDDAQICTVEFNAGQLGRARILAERDFTALRWTVRDKGRKAVLIDSLGSPDLTVRTVHYSTPAVEYNIEVAEALEGFEISDDGALVVARAHGHEAAKVVVPRQRATNFAQLAGQAPQVPNVTRDAAAVLRLARMAALWERARIAGSSLADMRRTSAVEALESALTGLVAGGRWVDAEDAFRSGSRHAAVNLMKSLIAARPDERAVAVVLEDRLTSVAESQITGAEAALTDALRPFVQAPDLEAVAHYALRLAGSPLQARAFAEACEATGNVETREKTLVDALLARPVILRAARYMVLATRVLLTDRGREDRMLPWRN